VDGLSALSVTRTHGGPLSSQLYPLSSPLY